MALIATGCQHKTSLTSGIDTDNFDTTVRLEDDFYQYACGGWMARNPLDAEHSRYGAFDVLAEKAQEDLRGIIDSVSAMQNEAGSLADKIATLYNIGMDSVRLQEQGATPLMPYLEEINSIKTRDDVWENLGSVRPRYSEEQHPVRSFILAAAGLLALALFTIYVLPELLTMVDRTVL